MPKFACRCGAVLDLGPMPAPDAFVLLSDADRARAEELARVSPERADDHVGASSRQVYACRACGRLHVERAPGAGVFDPYAREP